jgi:ferric-dicitrate binding protein FerR (iron transport regulator)
MEERIKYLFRQYLNNACTRKEFEEFFSYINDASNNELIRELIKKVYDETGQEFASFTFVDEQGKLVLTKPEWAPESSAGTTARRKKYAVYLAAAIVVLATGFIWIFNTLHPQQQVAVVPALTKKITERSEYKYLLLPDSTQVWLNAASSLEYPKQFDKEKREVFLSGEAWFDVKHADKQPFIIHTGKVSTRVLGTAFNIKAYPGRENITVSVSRGKVRVSYEEKEVAVLTKGQQVKVGNTGNHIVAKKAIATEAADWQQGNLVYDDETFGDIITDLERIYDVTIRVKNEALVHEHITTSFRREIGIEKALELLSNLTDTRVIQVNNMYVIQ